MHLRGVCDLLARLAHDDAVRLYERAKRLVERGLVRRGSKGHGVELDATELARVVVVAFLPMAGARLLEQAERLLLAREYIASSTGGLVATGTSTTFEERLVAALADGGGDIASTTLTAALPYAELDTVAGETTVFAPSRSYRKGQRLALGQAIVPQTLITRLALQELAQALRRDG